MKNNTITTVSTRLLTWKDVFGFAIMVLSMCPHSCVQYNQHAVVFFAFFLFICLLLFLLCFPFFRWVNNSCFCVFFLVALQVFWVLVLLKMLGEWVLWVLLLIKWFCHNLDYAKYMFFWLTDLFSVSFSRLEEVTV